MEIKIYIGAINSKKESMPWNSHDFETINNTAYYHEDVVELLAELENRITITGVCDTDYECDINE